MSYSSLQSGPTRPTRAYTHRPSGHLAKGTCFTRASLGSGRSSLTTGQFPACAHRMKTEPLLLKIVSRDDLGRVRTLEVVYDHETVDVSDPANREFIIAHVERGVMKKVNARPAQKRTGN